MLLSLIASTLLAAAPAPRVISVGSAVTEIVYALNAQTSLVGVDSSSMFPAAAQALPQVGYFRSLSSEGLLSLEPTLVIASADAGPEPVFTQLAAAGVRVVRITSEPSHKGVIAKIEAVAQALDKKSEGAALAQKVEAEIQAALAEVQKHKTKPRALFIYARGQGNLNVAGRDTAAHAMLELAGATNTAAAMTGYKPLTAESAVAAQPEYLVATTHGLASIGGAEVLLKTPGVAATPAGQHKRIIALDDLLAVGFGPRLGEAIRTLSRALHGG